MKYLTLIRFKNLVLIVLMQSVFHFVFLPVATYTQLTDTNNFVALSHFQFVLLTVATVCIAAGGYIINDIFDQQTDAIANKRIVGVSVSESTAYNLYVIVNVLGVAIGFYLSNNFDKPSFTAFFIITSALLYVYATTLKRVAVVGNVIVALLVALSVVLIGIFDLVPSTHFGNEIWEGNKIQMQQAFKIITDYAIFCFLINFIREIVKDVEDTDADYASGIATLPVLIGKKRTVKMASFLGLFSSIILVYYITTYLYQYNYVVYYFLLFIVAPLLIFSFKSWSAKKQSDYKGLSLLLKIILFFGILSVFVITYSYKN